MKATLSKDGAMRFTVMVPFRVDAIDLVNAVSYALTKDTTFDEDVDKAAAVEKALKRFNSRRSVFEAVKLAVIREGDTFWTWSEDCGASKEVISLIDDQVRALVAKRFPELRAKIL